jgi:hypothetical protein
MESWTELQVLVSKLPFNHFHPIEMLPQNKLNMNSPHHVLKILHPPMELKLNDFVELFVPMDCPGTHVRGVGDLSFFIRKSLTNLGDLR